MSYDLVLKSSKRNWSREILGMDEILGEFVGEEERALAAEGGQCERNALRRRFAKPGSTSGFNSHRAFMK
jgi:hypothetical protein